MPIKSMRDDNLFFVDVDLVDISTEKIHAADHFSDRIDDVGQVQIARRDLVQHRSEEKKVLTINDSDFEARIVTLLELQRSIKPAETATENKHACLVAHNSELKNAPFGTTRQAARLERAALRCVLESIEFMACIGIEAE